MAKISVVILTYNRKELLKRTLIGFTLQDYKEFEIVVIDDGRDDYTEEVVQKYRGQLNISYYYQNNKSKTTARNNGINNANGVNQMNTIAKLKALREEKENMTDYVSV